jgi:hypothetical protein
MKTIGELLTRDLSQQIEEVIKLDQRDEKTVHDEITEYVATERIKDQYINVLDPISKGPGEPTEAVGIWVSGFFGSGKSSFAKNLGYILANRDLLGTPASQLFMNQLQKQSPGDAKVKRIGDLLGYINKRFSSHVIMFDVRVDRAVRRENVSIAEILYSVLLREMDYAQDYDVAELEIELEGEGRLAEFVKTCAKLFAGDVNIKPSADPVPVTLESMGVSKDEYDVWRMVRIGAQKVQRTSVIMHEIKPDIYPTADSWAQALKTQADITIRTLVDRTFDLGARRKPGHTIIFVIDEVGQYVARSVEKIDNLRAVVEQFGQQSKNRVLVGKAIAPVWIVVTSQEKLEEVVSAIGDKRVQLAMLQDRFRYRVDMAPADIREVATRRVLSKKAEAVPVLRKLYQQSAGQLLTHTHPERSNIKFDVSEDDFVQFYPYLPHFVELSIDIVSGMRLQAGAPRQIGGSNRTIIKQAYEMLVSERTRLADKPIGELVTLDRIFDLVEGNLPSERQRDINNIQNLAGDDPWPVRTAKAIALLEYVRGLPRTEQNLAALLYRSLDSGSPLPDVERSIALLREKQFIRQTEDGWKLLTDAEKNWTTERNCFSPMPKERRDLWEDRLRTIFTEASLSRYVLQKRTFKLDFTWENRTLAQGEIPVELRLADAPGDFDARCEDARKDSRSENKKVFWVFSSTDEIDDQVVELYRSKQMVAKYDQLRAQNKINPDESSNLANEKLEAGRREESLKRLIVDAFQKGTGFFDGVGKVGPDMGKSASEILKAMLDYAVPQLYSKIKSIAMKGNEADEILRAANLNGLSKVFYTGPDSLGLVITEGRKYVVNTQAETAREVLSYLEGQHSYGSKVTGRMVEDKFSGIPYGWERDMLYIILASLLRGGAIEITYQGKKFRNHLDAQIRAAFAATNAFRSSSFAPRKSITLSVLVNAAKRYEELTGEDVDVDEAAIAQAFQNLAKAEMEALHEVEAVARANHIPVLDLLAEYRNTLTSIIQGASDDVVNILEGEGESFKQLRKQVSEIRAATNEEGLRRLRRARAAVNEYWPVLSSRGADSGLGELTGQLNGLIKDVSYYRHKDTVDKITQEIEKAYQTLYCAKHDMRTKVYQKVLDEVKGLPEWASLQENTEEDEEGKGQLSEVQKDFLSPLTVRYCSELKINQGQASCETCGATIPQMESDLVAATSLRNEVILRIQEFLRPEEKVERVKVSDIINHSQAIATEEEVNQVLENLRDYLMKLLDSGTKVILE